MGTVRGRFQSGVRPLPYAVIEATSAIGRYGAVADSVGRYVLRRLPAGELRVRATHTGHASVTLTVRLPENGELIVDLELNAEPLELPGINVRAGASPNPPTGRSEGDPVPIPALEVELLDISPGVGEAGLADAVHALPGNNPTDPTDVLFMRGSTTDLKLVLLDGVPVHTPFHVAGLMRSFDPTVLRSAKLYVGGAPARYDGGLTHILELETRSARRDRTRVSGSIDLLATSLAAETPLGSRAGVVASARALHGLGDATLGGERPYGYRDVLVSLDADPGADHRVRATGFWNSESVRLDFGPESGDATWGNRAGSVRYSGPVGPVRLDVTAGASAYSAELPLLPIQIPGEPDRPAVLASSETERVRLVAEAAWGGAAGPMRAGLSYEGLRASFAARSLTGDAYTASRGSSTVLGVFLDVTRPFSDGVTVRGGLRGDVFSGRTPRLAPRVAVLWELGPDVLLTIAAGRYHQVTRTPDGQVEETLLEFSNNRSGSGELLPVATADHVVLSLDQRLAGNVRLGIQGFWKRFEGLSGREEGSVRSSGIDLRVLSVGERTTVWLGYGLSWFWSPLDLSGHPADFVGRHLLSVGMSGHLSGPLHAEARVAYGAGLPYTSISFGSAVTDAGPGEQLLGGSRTSATGALPTRVDDEFLRIDLEIHALLEPEWGGRRWSVRPYLRLLNALDRRDALFYTYQPWRSDAVTPLAERPILPIFGVSFSF